jgi:hypothetical protein
MATLGTQTISTSYNQLLKTFGSNIVDATMRAISSGDEAGVSALQICTTGAKSTGTLAVDGASTLLGPVTFGSNTTLSTGTTTIATASISTATIGTATISTATISTATISTATISTATIPLQLGPVTFGSNVTMSTGTTTTGTLFASGPATFGTNFTASTGTATIGTLFASGPATFGTNFTASTGTATIGTIASTTINNTGTVTVGTLEIGANGPNMTKVSFGTAAFSSATVQPHNLADTTTGTFGLTGAELGDIIIGSINSLGSTTGTAQIMTNFYPIASNVVRYAVIGKGATAGTIPAGTIFATAMRFTT